MNTLYEDISTALAYKKESSIDFFHGYNHTSSGLGYLNDVVNSSIIEWDNDYIYTIFDNMIIKLCDNTSFVLVEEYGGNNEKYGLSYYKIYKFLRGDEITYVKFDGIHRSHYGSDFHAFYKVNAVEKNEVTYE